MSFEGKLCLVTGGTRGIGKATVEAFAKEQARIFTCSRNEEELQKRLEEWKAEGYDVQGCVCDVSDLKALTEMVKKVAEVFAGKLHILVNNAGFNIRRKVLDFTEEEYSALMETNLKSAFNLSRLCHPLLKEAGSSSIVHVGSIAGGPKVLSSGCVYAMAKASLSQMSKTMACEWAADGIRTNCVAPGYIETPLVAHLFANKEFFAELVREAPMRRPGQPNEIADAIVFFSSSKASYITGQTLYVDGGYSVRGLGY